MVSQLLWAAPSRRALSASFPFAGPGPGSATAALGTDPSSSLASTSAPAASTPLVPSGSRARKKRAPAAKRAAGRRTPGEQLALGLAVLPAGWCIVGDTVYDAEGTARGPAVAYDASLEAACRTRGHRFTPAAERARQDEWLLDWVGKNGIKWRDAVREFQAQFPTATLGSHPNTRLSAMYHQRAMKHGRQAPQELTSLGFPAVLPPGWYLEDGTAFDAGGVARAPAEAWRASEEAMAAATKKA
ncbi:hypothetical protein TSOC_008826, partial [Tetrabaena socialis]